MDMSSVLELVGDASYFAAALLFILGLKRMASPVTARDGIVWAGVGMLIAVLATLIQPDMHNRGLMLVGIGIGASLAWVSGKRVAMTDMPQMVALYNGMGGGAAAAIGAVELLRFAAQMAAAAHPDAAVAADAAPGAEAHASHITQLILGSTGSLIGAISFSGSLIAFAKLQGWMDRRFVFPGQQYFNASVFALAIALGVAIVMVLNQPAVGPAGMPDAHVDVAGALALNQTLIVGFFVAALAVGVLMTLPIGGADMPVVISLYNALTGLAVAFEGFVLQNETLIIAGTVVGAAGTLLTQLMAKAMNRSLASVLFSNFGASGEAQAISGAQKPIEAGDVAAMMAYAERVVIVPGYGMAVAQAQHKIWELTQLLIKRGVKVKFAIHPVAGRMPGHMNVLLAEAGVSYDLIADMDDINPEFPNTDVALVIGANDVVNPAAKTDPASPIYGMPILDVVAAKNAIVIKRGKGTGFAGIENALFYADNTRMLYGDGAEMANRLVAELKAVDGGH